MPRVSRKARQIKTSKSSHGLELREIFPKGEKQRQTFESFFENHLLLHGVAGTGKTFCALYLSLQEILDYSRYHRIVIVRSAVQTRDQGFMPGNVDEKMAYYEAPYREAVNFICQRGDAYDILKSKGIIEFMSTSFIRGITLDHSIVIVDEIQNMNFGELDSVITRVGADTKIVFAGDFIQSDLRTQKERQGLMDFIKILDQMKGIEHVEFRPEDIVRSGFVKQYILTKMELNL